MSESVPTITIHIDAKCTRCGKAGAVAENPSGLCLRCITKFIRTRRLKRKP
jgi:hypothetical protein